MLIKVFGAAVQGIEATLITIEVNSSRGCMFYMVGLPDSAVKESHQRILSALQVTGYKMPTSNIVINMAPADIRKEGSSYDLPLAIGMLAAGETISCQKLSRYIMMGELSLDGTIQPIKGALPIAIKAREEGFDGLIVPSQNAREAAVVNNLSVYGVNNIQEVIEFINGKRELTPTIVNTREKFYACQSDFEYDFADVKGQENVKRALEVAAAGGHNLIMVGAPGSGKSMMAKRLPSILPPLSLGESLETTKIHSVAGKLGRNSSLISQRPFRDPHHTISQVAMVGGGSFPQPGEISLAHNGVLFLDELPEFSKSTMEVLRQPLEEHQIHLTRAVGSVTYPSDFLLLASMNPCNCGYYPDRNRCRCTQASLQRYFDRISQPLIDRMDLCVEAPMVTYEELTGNGNNESSKTIRDRVCECQERQIFRFKDEIFSHNSGIPAAKLNQFCKLGEKEQRYMENMFHKLSLTARTYHKILRVARTIADTQKAENIRVCDLTEAVCYRSIGDKFWGGMEE